MAQMGTNIGSFIYIENEHNKEKMKEKMNEALEKCLGMAMSLASNKEQFLISSKNSGFKQRLKYKIENKFSRQNEDDENEGELKRVA